jgi:hypothetical protein
MITQQQLQQHMQQQQQQKNGAMKGQCLLRLLQFSEHLSGYGSHGGPRAKDDLTYWTSFVDQFFSKTGVFRLSLYVATSEPNNEDHGTDKQYEITQPALARYFHTHFQSGIKNMQLILERGTMDKPLPSGHFIENQKASLIYWFENSHVSKEDEHLAHYIHDTNMWLGCCNWEPSCSV